MISTSEKDGVQVGISADGNEYQENETEQQQTNKEYGRINEIEFIHSDDHTVNQTVATDSNQMLNEMSSRKPRILTGELNGWFVRRKSRKSTTKKKKTDSFCFFAPKSERWRRSTHLLETMKKISNSRNPAIFYDF